MLSVINGELLKFSIIIPVLNEEKLLPRLLKQLTENDLRKKNNYEIIVCDGGSIDKSIVIAGQYADKVVLDKSSKKTIAGGRNRGAEAASGEILIFLNADIFLKNFSVLLEETEKGLSGKYFGITSKIMVHPSESKFSDSIFLGFYNRYFRFLNLIGVGMGRGEFQAVRKSTFRKLNGFRENLAAGEDFDFFRRVRALGPVLFLKNVIIFESPRRYRKTGHFKILLSWLLNSIFVIFLGRSLNREWKQIR